MRDGVSLYVHFPWCLQKCPYCDFASAPLRRDRIPHDAYADAVVRELEARTPRVADRELVSIFFGGGTPSLWSAAAVGRVIAAGRRAFAREAPDLEVTVECNPTSLDADRAAALAAVGVNRLSVGVQSLDEGRLLRLGRLHTGRNALAAVRAAIGAVPRASADVIFGLDRQTPDEARDDVSRLLDLGLTHVSAYALTLEPGTRFGELARRGRRLTVDEDDFADSYQAVERACAAAGLEHYEVSNYARPGQRSVHNLHYWAAGEYLGVGAGAVGRIGTRRWRNEADASRYLATPDAPEVWTEALDPVDLVREGLMLGLRTTRGVCLRTLERAAGVAPRGGREAAIARAVSRGDLVDGGSFLRIPAERWLRADGIVAALF